MFIGPWRTKEKKRKKSFSLFDFFKGKSSLVTKIVVSFAAFAMGIGFILIFVHSIFPALISDALEEIDQDFATELFEKTAQEKPYVIPAADAEQVFEQPEEQEVLFPRDCFSSVLSDNPDIVGRLSMIPLDITYLVTQSDDNVYYLKKGYDKQKNKSGTIFLDYRCNANIQPLSGHYILYGHNMKNGSMFHNLVEYKNEFFFYDNPTFHFDTLYEDYEWEIFSAYISDTQFYFIDTDFENEDQWLTFLYQIKSKSIYQTDTTLLADDVILTLCTCTYEFDDARFVVHAKLKNR